MSSANPFSVQRSEFWNDIEPNQGVKSVLDLFCTDITKSTKQNH